jgi:hypothetical protein
MSGIDKKISAQIDIFNSNGMICNLHVLKFKYGLSKFEQLLCRLPFSNINPKWEYSKDFENNDFVYFRKPLNITIHTLRVLKKMKDKNPKVKIIMEIPTYPYEKELLVQVKLWPFYIKDIINRRKLKNYVDRIAVFTNDDLVLGIPTLKFSNGVDLGKIKPKKAPKVLSKRIDLCIVSTFEEWHGYDRVLHSLAQYYNEHQENKEEVFLHIVGDGQKYHEYKEIVKKNILGEHVKFYGKLYGKDLDNIYSKSDIGVDVFGMYRKGHTISNSLKSREYFAKGLPVISGCLIDVLENKKDFKYFKQFSNDDSIFDMSEVVNFYHQVYDGREVEDLITDIRLFAEKFCGMKNGMSRIINYLEAVNK